MPEDNPTVDDNPLTIVDINQFSAPNTLLARKIAAHLPGEWAVGNHEGSLAAALIGPEGEVLTAYVTNRRDEWEIVIRGVRPPELPPGIGYFPWTALDVPLATPPSELARAIEHDLMPAYRKTLAEVRARLDEAAAEQARRLERAEALAARLGPDWYVKAHTDKLSRLPLRYYTVERPQQRRQIFGSFCIDSSRQRTVINLCNSSPDTIEAVVEAILRQHESDPHAQRRWPKRLNRALILMHEAGYSTDKLGFVHQNLFGRPLFKFDNRVAPGDSVVDYLRDRPGEIDRVISNLDPDGRTE